MFFQKNVYTNRVAKLNTGFLLNPQLLYGLCFTAELCGVEMAGKKISVGLPHNVQKPHSQIASQKQSRCTANSKIKRRQTED